MPKLPDKTALGGLGSARSGRDVITARDIGNGGTQIAQGVGDIGKQMVGIGLEEQKENDALDVIKAEAIRRPQMMELENTFDKDNDYKTFDERFVPQARAIDDEASKVIRNPDLRERFRYKADMETTQSRNRVLDKGTTLRKQDNFVQTDTALREMSGAYTSPNASDDSRTRTYAEMEAAIEVAKKNGLIDYSHADQLAKRHLYGNGGVLYREAEGRLWSDPYGVLSDLNAVGDAPKGSGSSITPRKDGLSTVRMPGGAEFHVSGKYADRFQGAVDELAAAGVEVKKDQSGGYNPRNIAGTNTPSKHASGEAIDINWTENAQGTKGKIDPEVARGIAAKWGLKWGGDFKGMRRDPMHFEVDPDAKWKTPTVERSDLPDIGEGDQQPRLPATRTPASERYARLAPEARAHLMTRARIALSATVQQDLADDAERIRRTGEPERDAEGRTALDRAGRVLTPNQLAKARISQNEAGMEYKAVTPLAEMSEGEALAHLERLQPAEKAEGESYRSATRVLAKAQRQWKAIQETRDKDPGQAAAMSPEVKLAFEQIRARRPELAIDQDENGELTVVEGSSPTVTSQKARVAIMEARLAAQARWGLPDYARKGLSKREAATLLDMGDPSLLDERQYITKLRAASERANAQYGPEYGRKAFEDAVALQIKSKEHRETAAGVISKMVRGEAVTRRDYARLNALNDIDRAGSVFDRSTDTREYGPNSDRSGLWLSPTLMQAQAQKKMPTQQQVDWVKQDPAKRQPMFDAEFGNGAWSTYQNKK